MQIKYDNIETLKYRVTETFWVDSKIPIEHEIRMPFANMSKNSIITLYPGFCWNGTDVLPDFQKAQSPSAVHDFLCNAMAIGLLPYNPYWQYAAALMRQMLMASGMCETEAEIYYGGLMAHGKIRYGVKEV